MLISIVSNSNSLPRKDVYSQQALTTKDSGPCRKILKYTWHFIAGQKLNMGYNVLYERINATCLDKVHFDAQH